MTRLFESSSKNAGTGSGPAGTHVLVIGIGEYPYLLGGKRKLYDKPHGMGQLSSPSHSAIAVANWFLGNRNTNTPSRFSNPVAPLSSLELLVAPCEGYVRYDGREFGQITVPERVEIEEAFEGLMERVGEDPQNIGVLYFCGHGCTAAYDYLLAADFGHRRIGFADAIDLTSTVRAARRLVSGSLFFFIDACREIVFDPLSPGETPSGLFPLNLKKPVMCYSSLVLMSTSEGRAAFGETNDISRFTKALLSGLSDSYVEESRDGAFVVTGETISRSVTEAMRSSTETSPAERQEIERALIGSASLHFPEKRSQRVLGNLVLWKPMSGLRAVVGEIASGQPVPDAVLEALAEQLEQTPLQDVDSRVRQWLNEYRELDQRLTIARSVEQDVVVGRLLHSGKFELAGVLLEQLAKDADSQLSAQITRVADIWFKRGEVERLRSGFKGATQYYARAYELDASEPSFGAAYGRTLLANERYADAEVVLTKTLDVIDNSPVTKRRVVVAAKALCLFGLAAIFDTTNRATAAVHASSSALLIRRELAGASTDALADLGESLLNHGLYLKALRRDDDAQTVWLECLDVYRSLVNKGLDHFRPHLAGVLTNLSFTNDRCDASKAKGYLVEALDTFQQLPPHLRSAFTNWEVNALNKLAGIQNDEGQHDAALDTLLRCLKLCEEVKSRSPLEGLNLAARLNLRVALHYLLLEGKLDPRAESYLADAGATLFDLVERDAKQAMLLRIYFLRVSATFASTKGEMQAAESAMLAAIDVARALVSIDPALHSFRLATCIAQHADLLRRRLPGRGPRKRAMLGYEEAIELYRGYRATPEFAEALMGYGQLLRSMKRYENASGIVAEAVRTLRELAKSDLDLSNALATGLHELANIHADLGQLEASRAYRFEAENLRDPATSAKQPPQTG
jgi:tetratricopeptide (TPR) repeat protein